MKGLIREPLTPVRKINKQNNKKTEMNYLPKMVARLIDLQKIEEDKFPKVLA